MDKKGIPLEDAVCKTGIIIAKAVNECISVGLPLSVIDMSLCQSLADIRKVELDNINFKRITESEEIEAVKE